MIPGIFIIIQLVFLTVSSFLGPDDTISQNTDPFNAADSIYQNLSCPEIEPEVFRMAFNGYSNLHHQQILSRDTILTIIDYSKPSTVERFFIIDLKNERVIQKSLVAHGKNSGLLFAKDFSNTPHSNQSSLGFFVTENTYYGKHGYSLRIRGLENNINNNAMQRAIVIHGANYVSNEFIKKYGRLGRSFGCPALPNEISNKVIDLIKDASCLFIYSGDKSYLRSSSVINPNYYSQIVPE